MHRIFANFVSFRSLLLLTCQGLHDFFPSPPLFPLVSLMRHGGIERNYETGLPISCLAFFAYLPRALSPKRSTDTKKMRPTICYLRGMNHAPPPNRICAPTYVGRNFFADMHNNFRSLFSTFLPHRKLQFFEKKTRQESFTFQRG